MAILVQASSNKMFARVFIPIINSLCVYQVCHQTRQTEEARDIFSMTGINRSVKLRENVGGGRLSKRCPN